VDQNCEKGAEPEGLGDFHTPVWYRANPRKGVWGTKFPAAAKCEIRVQFLMFSCTTSPCKRHFLKMGPSVEWYSTGITVGTNTIHYLHQRFSGTV